MPETRQSILVGATGFTGGIISYLWAWTTDAGPLGQSVSWAVAFPLYCLGGIAASLIGVFLMANTERRDLIRLGVTGLLFGIFWVPVLEQSRGYAASIKTTNAVENVDQHATALENGDVSPNEGIAALVKASAELVTKTGPQIEDPDVRAAVSDSILKSVVAIQSVRETSPEAAQNALGEIKGLAESAELPVPASIASMARESLGQAPS